MNDQNKNTEMTPAEAADAEYARAKAYAARARELSQKARAEAENNVQNAESAEEQHQNTEPCSEQSSEQDSSETPSDEKKTPPTELQKLQYLYRTEKLKNKRRRGFVTAAVLSSCSIVLLVAVFFAAMLGLLPSGNGVYLQVSGSGPVAGEGYEDRSAMLEAAKQSVVVISCDGTGYGGTGFILSENGYIATNYHVIEGAKGINVQLYGTDKTVKATIVGYSQRDDIAVLKIDKTGLSPITFAKQADCRMGEDVYAIGTPHSTDFGWSVSRGIISAFDREVCIYDDEGILEKKMYLLQTDAAANHGNSGGPLINARGEVVGIVTLKLSDNENVNFAIPSDGALALITAIIETGSADGVTSTVTKGRPLIGITGVGVEAETYYENIEQNGQSMIQPVDKAYADANPGKTFYAAATGVYVSKVTPTADAAGKIKVGDIISEVDGTPVLTIYEVMAVINQKDGGDTVKITFWRDGKTNTVSVTLGTAE